jgi:histone H3/H4
VKTISKEALNCLTALTVRGHVTKLRLSAHAHYLRLNLLQTYFLEDMSRAAGAVAQSQKRKTVKDDDICALLWFTQLGGCTLILINVVVRDNGVRQVKLFIRNPRLSFCGVISLNPLGTWLTCDGVFCMPLLMFCPRSKPGSVLPSSSAIPGGARKESTKKRTAPSEQESEQPSPPKHHVPADTAGILAYFGRKQ